MIYLYTCQQCNKTIEIEKSMYVASRKEKCVTCDSELVRVYSAVGIKTFGDGVKV